MFKNLGYVGWILVVVSMGCGDDSSQGTELAADRSSFSDQLDTAKKLQTKGDEFVACGSDTCEPSACGYDCTVVGQCERACALVPQRDQTEVKLDITGSITTKLDSTEHAFEPVLSLDNVLFFGCELWDFSNQTRDDLEVSFAEIYRGGFAVGDPENIGRRAVIDIRDYRGPGTYTANGFFSESSAQREKNDYYYGTDACTMTVRESDHHGIAGEITCDIPNKSLPRNIRMTGTFACGMDAMSVQIIKL
ncbi:MAG: hypothetical protein R3E66_24690 [bacterium]